MNLSLFIARRYFLHRKGAFSSFIIKLAIAATAISVATMILAMAIVTGFKHEVREKLFSFWGHVHIQPRTLSSNNVISPNPINRDLILESQVSNTEHVNQLAAFAIRPAILNVNGMIEGIQLKGVDENYKLYGSIDVKGSTIDFRDTSYSKDIILSQTTADRMNVKAGDAVLLNFIEPGADLPRIRKVVVRGIYHTGMEEIDKYYAICDLRLLQRVNNWQSDQINGYQLTLDDEKLSDTVSMQIFNEFIKPPLTTYTMKDLFPNVFDWLNLQDVETNVIIAIMAIVAIINLAAALLILIVEQVRMVGILKAQGMTKQAIQRIFLYHAGIISVLGVAIGNLVAFAIYWLQKTTGFLKLTEATYSMNYVPVRLNWWQPVMIDIATVVICILCMWLPALYIRRIQPAKVLQFK